MPPEDEKPRPIECPRCGYDLSGAAAAWPPGQCGMETVCSECGLNVLWRDVLNESYRTVLGFFELARVHRVRAFFKTVGHVLRPWSLWRWIRMQFPIVWWKAGFAAFGTAIVLHAAVVAFVFAAFCSLGYRWARSLPVTSVLVWPYATAWIDWEWGGGRAQVYDVLPPGIMIGLVTTLAVPASFSLLPVTLRNARVRACQLFRIAIYTSGLLPLIIGSLALVGSAFGLCYKWLGVNLVPGDIFEVGSIECVPILVAAVILFIAWRSAARHYLRLPHASAVATLLVLFSALLSSLLVMAVSATWRSGREWLLHAFF